MRYIKAIALFLCFLGIIGGAKKSYATERQHALAMHGSPKYSADFKNLDYVDPSAKKKGRIRHGVTGSFDNLNHHIINGTAAQGLERLNDRLMARVWDEPFTMYGLVAETIEIPEDRSWITFHLRPTAQFHDGKKMTVDDVIFSHEMYKEHGHPVRRRVYSLVNKVTKISDGSVRFDFGEGYDAETALILAMMPVLPKHYWEGRNINKTTLTPPLGSGPYKIKQVDAGRRITYERVADYWAKDLPVNVGHYNFDEVDYLYYRDDSVALEAFKSGDYDIRREWDASKWRSAYDFQAVTDGHVKKEQLSHGRPEWVRSFIFNTRKPLFKDREVRKALSYVFDFEWMNKNLFYGQFKRINSFFPNSKLATSGTPKGDELNILTRYKEHLPDDVFGEAFQSPKTNGSGPAGLRQNLRMAIKILKNAGWAINPETKKLTHDKTGEVFAFEILLGSPAEEKIALEYARGLKRLGIDAKIRTVDSAQFTGRLEQFDYDMTVFRWVNSLSPGNEQMNYWSCQAAKTNGSRNYAGVCNVAIDAIADSIARAPSRKDLVTRTHALDRALTWGYYTVPLYYLGHDLVAYQNILKRPDKTPLYGMVLEAWSAP